MYTHEFLTAMLQFVETCGKAKKILGEAGSMLSINVLHFCLLAL
jgi:hypothetical protein